ncbi:MAG: hypothetical protein KY460_05965 [Actinobacteria bacterium]|nr:hypothetical protein [Actinomycetota bacterium]
MRPTNYLVSMALIVSGVATFIQIRRIGPIGSGLLSIQGTTPPSATPTSHPRATQTVPGPG